MTLVHGGQLQQVALQYARPIVEWLDLSTGISPSSYPIPSIPTPVWQQLPQPSQSLVKAAKLYYATTNIVATSGSQAVIKQLPTVFKQHVAEQTTVWLPQIGYKEHERAWREQGFTIQQYTHLPTSAQLTAHCIVVVINPNNPTGELFSRNTLLALLDNIQMLKGWLILDEAFMDVVEPSQSIIAHTDNPHLLVLRSVGKFFGLAGIRLGFLSAHQQWLQALETLSSPWEVNGPAQYITEKALMDTQWQQQQLLSLTALSAALELLLMTTFDCPVAGSALFKSIRLDNAPAVYALLCQQGIYVRLCDEQNALRFGIPDQNGLAKLTKVLQLLPK
ncbi:threonine-phosphate decarboxylase CobD [Moritella yayanosii]|uniref:threonine-phosphate decarboxylase n=1 Tax=Moritella yayanosii TaxID=69539 RepID=A0A330LTR3_9GAMM|nr:threonine-phosphate decarboxylase CobD [Moritella yayanosii]SQD80260.1 Threonine-phosphate decarboxylase [Moritella yayanosii]